MKFALTDRLGILKMVVIQVSVRVLYSIISRDGFIISESRKSRRRLKGNGARSLISIRERSIHRVINRGQFIGLFGRIKRVQLKGIRVGGRPGCVEAQVVASTRVKRWGGS